MRVGRVDHYSRKTQVMRHLCENDTRECETLYQYANTHRNNAVTDVRFALLFIQSDNQNK
jgi:hypothetical protein